MRQFTKEANSSLGRAVRALRGNTVIRLLMMLDTPTASESSISILQVRQECHQAVARTRHSNSFPNTQRLQLICSLLKACFHINFKFRTREGSVTGFLPTLCPPGWGPASPHGPRAYPLMVLSSPSMKRARYSTWAASSGKMGPCNEASWARHCSESWAMSESSRILRCTCDKNR